MRNDLPVRPGKTAVGHRAVDQPVVVVAGLQHHPRGEQKPGRRRVDGRAPARVNPLGTADIVEARGVHAQPHVAVRGVDQHAVGTAGDLEMSIRLEF